MVIIWLVLLVGLLYLLQLYVYNKYWKMGVNTGVRFKQSAITEGEKGILEEMVENAKILPIIALKVKFQTSRDLRFEDTSNNVVTDNYYRNDIISVGPYRKLTRELHFTGTKRGYYVIDGMSLVGTDLFMRSQMVSENPCHTALYVYPKPYRDAVFNLSLQKLNGEILTKRHLIEDPFEFRGIREYEPYDDMRYIHWKSTAKTGDLKVVMKNYTAVKNIRIFLYLQNNTMIKREELLENSIRIVVALVENYLALGSNVEVFSNGLDSITGQLFSIEKISNKGHLENMYKSLARLGTQILPAFESTLEEKFFEDTNTATILVSPYGHGDFQDKLIQYMEKNDSIFWVCPKRHSDKIQVDDRLKSHFTPVLVEE